MKEKIDELTSFILTIILVFLPLAIIPNKPDTYYDLKAITLFLCGGILLITFLLKIKTIKFNIEDIFIVIFAILAIISTIFSLNIKQSIIGAPKRFEGILSILTYILIYFHAKNTFKEFKGFKSIVLTAYIGICCLAILQYYMPPNIGSKPIFGKGAHGTIGNTNFMGSFISIILPIFMLLYIIKENKKCLLFSTIAFSVMIMCIARSGWVSFLFYMLITVIYLIINKDKTFWKRFFLLFIIFVITFVFIVSTEKNNIVLSKFHSIRKDFETMKDSGISDNMGSTRIVIWKITITVIQNRPLIGCGVDTLMQGLEKYGTEEYWEYIFEKGCYIDKAHNEYLQMAATMGIPALIIYLCFIASIIIPNLKNMFKDTKTTILITTITSYLIQAFFNISVIAVAPLFWFTLGIASRYKNEAKK